MAVGAVHGFVTVHPSFLLRLPDEASKAAEYSRFITDLRRIRTADGGGSDRTRDAGFATIATRRRCLIVLAGTDRTRTRDRQRGKGPGAQFDISIDGTVRSHRDRREVAIQAAEFLKRKEASAEC
jgi:hypothetical protein